MKEKIDFLGIGAQKSGTTSLNLMLSQHYQIFTPKIKELQYFSTENYQKGLEWYYDYFKNSRDEQINGEITPYYIFHPESPKRIYDLNPNIKLIALLRDPVDRAISGYFHTSRLNLDKFSLEDAIDSEEERLLGVDEILSRGERSYNHQNYSYLSRSRYEEQLERYLKYFSREQIYIARSEDLKNHEERIWKEILQFLGVDQIPLSQKNLRLNTSKGEVNKMNREDLKTFQRVRKKIRKKLEPTYKIMKEKYGITWS